MAYFWVRVSRRQSSIAKNCVSEFLFSFLKPHAVLSGLPKCREHLLERTQPPLLSPEDALTKKKHEKENIIYSRITDCVALFLQIIWKDEVPF